MPELGPDHLMLLDRRDNVIKPGRGELVAISRLEAPCSHCLAIRRIKRNGTSERAFLVDSVVPTDEAIARGGNVRVTVRNARHEIDEHERLNGYENSARFHSRTRAVRLENGPLTEVGKRQ